MVTQKIRELEATKAKLASLEKTVAVELHQELASLPSAYGFESVADFVAAVKDAAKGRRGAKRGRPAQARKVTAPGKKARRRRAVITDEIRAGVKKLAGAGKTGAAIAKALKISLPTVQNIKKALGLVKARK